MARFIDIRAPLRFVSGGYPLESEDNDTLNDEIYSVIATVPGECPHRPTFGCFVSRLLFANMGRAAQARAVNEVKIALGTWVPAAIVDAVTVASKDTTMTLTVVWRPKSNPQQERRQTTLDVLT